MGLIVNPCEECLGYESQVVDYVKKVSQGNYEAFEGLRSLLDLALAEERNLQIESFLRENHESCNSNFCIYRRKNLEELSECIDEFRDELKEMEPEERREYLIEGFFEALLMMGIRESISGLTKAIYESS